MNLLTTFCLLSLILVLFPGFILSQNVRVPQSSAPAIDGTLNSGEWREAAETEFYGGEFLKFNMDEEYLYIGMRGKNGGFASLAILIGDRIKVLHSSTRLITAEYKKDQKGWSLQKEFSSLKGAKRNAPVNIQAQIEEFGWAANLVSEGKPEDTEFIISLDSPDRSNIRISLVFFQFKNRIKFASAPVNLNDDSKNMVLIQGVSPQNLNFDPSSWLKIELGNSE